MSSVDGYGAAAGVLSFVAGVGIGVAGFMGHDWAVLGVGCAFTALALGIIIALGCSDSKKEEKKREVTGPARNYQPQVATPASIWRNGKPPDVMWHSDLTAQPSFTYTKDGRCIPNRHATPLAPFENPELS